MKNKKNILLVLLLGFVVIVIVAFYFFPVFPRINPFFEKETRTYDDGSISGITYRKYSVFPTVSADLPSGWEIKTIIYEENINLATDPDESEMLVGDVAFEIYKDGSLVASLFAATGLGGNSGVYYNFPDSDPQVLQEMLGNPGVTISEVESEEYSELDIFGLEVRRVNFEYVPNTNIKDTYYFTGGDGIDPVTFNFGEDGPSCQLYFNNVLNENNNNLYLLRINTDDGDYSSQDLTTLDSILDSMELKSRTFSLVQL